MDSAERRSGPRHRVLFKSGNQVHSGDLIYQDARPTLVVSWRTIDEKRVPYILFPLDQRRLREADRQANAYRYDGPLFPRPAAAAASEASARDTTAERAELPALAATKTLRILVVEDNRDSAESLRRLLEMCGYAVTVAFTGEEGLEAALRAPPDVVLCDIGLPDRDGFSVASALRRHPSTSNARLIAVTAYASAEDERRSHDAGFQLHLVKPVRPAALLQQLAKQIH
jgi:CheY-like chemotaxis protein